MKETFEEKVQRLKGELLNPSDCSSTYIKVPHGIYGYDEENMTPQYGSITFEREYHDGICIGWKLVDYPNAT